MPFEVFEKRSAPRGGKAWVTIQRTGNFSLSEASYREIGSPAAVELLYDREAERVGIKPLAEESKYSFSIRAQRPKGGGSGTYLVAGQAFMKFYRLDSTIAKRFMPQFEDGMLIIDLQGEYTDASWSRAEKRKG